MVRGLICLAIDKNKAKALNLVSDAQVEILLDYKLHLLFPLKQEKVSQQEYLQKIGLIQ